MASINILIVEDESIIALDIKRSLMRLGYQVLAIADTGEGAIALAEEHLPDLVLMDIRLRGEMDGIEAATYLRERLNLPVVFLTAHADEITLKQAVGTSPFGYIVKPFETHDLTTAIEVALSRHQAEQATQRMLNTQRELSELKSQFIAIVSHEFRNPLSSIQFCLDLLERQPQLAPQKRQAYFQRARGAVDRMKELLEDVLILGEIESTGLPCFPQPTAVYEFCQELVEELQSLLTTPHHLDLAPPESPLSSNKLYTVDAKLLRHILVNLISNAVKYSPHNDRIHLKVQQQNEQILIQVQDHGIGIPSGDRSRLFSPFYRAENVNTIPGTGLGLAIVKKCVEAHGGEIWVDSQVGVGSTFTVLLSQQPLK